MSIPLDRLYHFLRNEHKHPILIYHFYPHGSKKLKDLTIIDEGHANHDRSMWVQLPRMIYHDQEPLNFDLYSKKELRSHIEKKYVDEKKLESVKEQLINFEVSLHLRGLQLSANHVYDYTLLCHSEKNSPQLDKYQEHGFLGVYYWSHAIIAKDWFRFAKHDVNLKPKFSDIKYDFLIYNRTWTGTREYRLKFADLLVKHNLVNNSKTSLTFSDQDIYYQNHNFTNNNFCPENQLENFFKPNLSTSSYSADYNNKDYASCGIEIVLETLFDDVRWHLTEKSLRPIACGRPFMLAATPGSLAYLRENGFKTFSGLIDESYDLVQDPVKRLNAIITEMQRIKNLDSKSKKILWSNLYKIAKENQDLFFSDHWEEKIIAEYQNNFELAMETLNNNRTGKYFKEYSKIDTIDAMIQAGERPDIIEETCQRRQKVFEMINKGLTNL